MLFSSHTNGSRCNRFTRFFGEICVYVSCGSKGFIVFVESKIWVATLIELEYPNRERARLSLFFLTFFPLSFFLLDEDAFFACMEGPELINRFGCVVVSLVGVNLSSLFYLF